MVRLRLLAASFAAALATTMMGGFGGPDLVICRVGGTGTTNGFMNLGASGGIRAYSADSITCNIGDLLCTWDAGLPEPDNNHPIISQTMFRLSGGRLTQIGQSWIKHAGNSTNQPECGLTCVPPNPANNAILVPGCCDAYNALTNGTQFAGPKSEVNPATGVFPYPFCSPPDGGMTCPSAAATIGRRLQVKESDIIAGAQYFFQIHIITPDEINVASPRTDMNNASYRPLAYSGFNILSWTGPTVSNMPAIKAWKLNGLGPGISDPNVIEAQIDVPGDGRFYLAAKASNIGGGLWQYDYAVQNYNSHRAAQSFTVPLPTNHGVSAMGFTDVDYHSGEPQSGTDWMQTLTSSGMTWSTDAFTANPNANAMRWDTMYTFRFQSTKPPATRTVQIGMFRTAAVGSPDMFVSATLPVPDADCNGNGIADSIDIANATSADANGDGVPDECPQPCYADINLDATVDVNDLLSVITAWGPCMFPFNCPADVAPTLSGDGQVDVNDLLSIITSWGPCLGGGP